MKRVNHYQIAIFLCMIIISAASCKKFDDLGIPYPESQLNACGIEKIIFHRPHWTGADTLTIEYNYKGDPVKITRPDPGTAAPNYIFKYKNGRLSDFMGVYKNGTTSEVWHRYIYDATGRVAIDSGYSFSQIVNGEPTDPVIRFASTFIYDSQNRIIKETLTWEDGSVAETNYQYDSNGNLIGPTYGDKLSFRRTNKIWMFIDRNYSVNNQTGYSNFNSGQLPKEMNFASGEDSFLDNYYYKASIQYKCD